VLGGASVCMRVAFITVTAHEFTFIVTFSKKNADNFISYT